MTLRRTCVTCNNDLTKPGSINVRAVVTFHGYVLPGDTPLDDEWDENGYDVETTEYVECSVCKTTAEDVQGLTLQAITEQE